MSNEFALKLVNPIKVTDATLISSTIPDSAYPLYSPTTTYNTGDRVSTADHWIYESVQDANTGNIPAGKATLWWVRFRPTNRWCMLDTSTSTQTLAPGGCTYRFRPGSAVGAVGVLNTVGCTSVRVQLDDPLLGIAYDKTFEFASLPQASDWWTWTFGARNAMPTQALFLDLPTIPTADLVVTFEGSSDLAIGTLVFGQMIPIGLGVHYGAEISIDDYSKLIENEWGDIELEPRAYSDTAVFNMHLLKSEVDNTKRLLTQLRKTPCLWVGTAIYEGTTIYGFYESFKIQLSYPLHADCSLTLKSMT